MRARYGQGPTSSDAKADAVSATRRGLQWRLVKSADSAQIDGAIALAIAAERAAQTVYAPRFIGWA